MRASSSRLAWTVSNTASCAPTAPLSICITSDSNSWLRCAMAAMPAIRAPPLSVCRGRLSAEYRAALKRPLHTLKGGARMAGIAAMAHLSHELESLVMQIDNGAVGAHDAVFDTVQASLDELARMRELVASGRPAAPARAVIARIQSLARRDGAPPAAAAGAPAAQAPVEPAPSASAPVTPAHEAAHAELDTLIAQATAQLHSDLEQTARAPLDDDLGQPFGSAEPADESASDTSPPPESELLTAETEPTAAPLEPAQAQPEE